MSPLLLAVIALAVVLGGTALSCALLAGCKESDAHAESFWAPTRDEHEPGDAA